jgi:hypothetical protein
MTSTNSKTPFDPVTDLTTKEIKLNNVEYAMICKKTESVGVDILIQALNNKYNWTEAITLSLQAFETKEDIYNFMSGVVKTIETIHFKPSNIQIPENIKNQNDLNFSIFNGILDFDNKKHVLITSYYVDMERKTVVISLDHFGKTQQLSIPFQEAEILGLINLNALRKINLKF